MWERVGRAEYATLGSAWRSHMTRLGICGRESEGERRKDKSPWVPCKDFWTFIRNGKTWKSFKQLGMGWAWEKGEGNGMIKSDSRTKHFGSHLEDRWQGDNSGICFISPGEERRWFASKHWQWEERRWDREKRYLWGRNNNWDFQLAMSWGKTQGRGQMLVFEYSAFIYRFYLWLTSWLPERKC